MNKTESGALKTGRILVVRTDRIGDVVLTTPAIRALKHHYPETHLTVLVAPLTEDLFRGNPDIDQVLVDDRRGRHQGIKGWFRLVREIRLQHFDCAINFHTKRRTNLLIFLAGISRRIGYSNNKFGFLLTDRILDVRATGEKHESQFCLDVLKAIDIFSQDQTLMVPCHSESEVWAENLIKSQGDKSGRRFIALHPGSSCATKMWPAKKFIELADILQNKFQARIVLVGASSVKEVAEEIEGGVSGAVLNTVGQTNVGQLTSLLKRCDLLVSNDSGPVHIAAALGVPVVSIFTRNQPGINPERWCPLGSKSRFAAPPLDMSLSFAKGQPEDSAYLHSISVEQVLDLINELI